LTNGVGWCWMVLAMDLHRFALADLGWKVLDSAGHLDVLLVNSSPRGVLGTSEALGALRPASSGDK